MIVSVWVIVILARIQQGEGGYLYCRVTADNTRNLALRDLPLAILLDSYFVVLVMSVITGVSAAYNTNILGLLECLEKGLKV